MREWLGYERFDAPQMVETLNELYAHEWSDYHNFFRPAAKLVPRAVVDGRGAPTGIVSLGSCDAPVREALAALRRSGVAIDYMRVRAFPFGTEVEEFLAAHQTIFVVEQNRDAQFRALLTMETAVDKKKLRSVLHYDGLSMTAGFVADAVGKVLAPGVEA